jgi:hypothetical protein
MAEHRTKDNVPGSDWFWSVIERARGDPNQPEEMLQERKEAVFRELSDEQLADFYYEYGDIANDLYPSRTIPERGMDEDDVMWASYWIIAQGREKYSQVWLDPESLPDRDGLPYLNYGGAADSIYWDRTGKAL